MAEREVVKVIGAGLAGVEAAWQLANRGIMVNLYEMRPDRKSPAHHTGDFAELVCSNSLRANALENAAGLLKEEMRLLNSLIMACAEKTRIPAGGALAVDRNTFARLVTEKLVAHPLVKVFRQEVMRIPQDGVVILATGPLTSESMAESIKEFTGESHLYFYDAVAPIVTYESIKMNKIFRSSRYGKGAADYLNCPMDQDEYQIFWQALVQAETAPRHEFEQETFFEGCMPVEVLARRGKETLLFGPLKPVGLTDPKTGRRPYAVVQLRQDNAEGTMFNLVGFQTNLKWDEQRRVIKLIPGLEEAEFARFGVMHRNTYINAPVLLNSYFQSKKRPSLFFAGQVTGVEGYVESAASGLMAGINAALLVAGRELVQFPRDSAHGALSHYITTADPSHFQPMNINFGLFPPLAGKIRDKKERYRMLAERALDSIRKFDEIIKIKDHTCSAI
ncbi:MAG: methylenetetrahydrofolate--tRNA-(uracil(54)-C(5))-methyltransferase (FADH(2)-oxidizing) TrmFO [Desulfotomaculaceae bacterium]|nr:methylenetetrahydrofolate--tRNA-(uracil(54)-C(5))-methyltransferase (FADH(2)-oxidizing) TrmFO [Desulfotomaculaceae bacterium]